jgi:hypothetical protein
LIDKNIVEQARNADIIAFLEKYHGFTFKPMGGGYRCQQHTSLAVKADRLSFYWHSRGVGGFGALDYLVKAENMAFREAVEVITGTTPPTVPQQREQDKAEPPKILVLTEKAGIQLRLYDYLCVKRGIDLCIVNALVQKEMLYLDKWNNVVFVGYDEHNKARFASLRGTHGNASFRGDCSGSDKRYGFTMAAYSPSERLYIFESPIDAMSHASLVNADTGDTGAWKRDNRLSLSGTSDTALNFFLNQHKSVKELVLCLDNDPAGREAAAIIARKYAAKGFTVLVHFPAGKDFNDDLQTLKQQIQADKGTKNAERNVII